MKGERRFGGLLLAALLMVGVACTEDAGPPAREAGDSPLPSTTQPVLPATSAPTTSMPSTSHDEPVTTTTASEADAAPDFSLDLGSGGTFVLSEETRPVFMVFWAEW